MKLCAVVTLFGGCYDDIKLFYNEKNANDEYIRQIKEAGFKDEAEFKNAVDNGDYCKAEPHLLLDLSINMYVQGNKSDFMISRNGSPKFNIKGKLHTTAKTVKILRCGRRTIYADEKEQQWVKVKNEWWKFPEEIDY